MSRPKLRVVLIQSILTTLQDETDPESVAMPIFISSGTLGTVLCCTLKGIEVCWDQLLVGSEVQTEWVCTVQAIQVKGPNQF